MTGIIDVTIQNKLVVEKRDINVYHHFTGSAHMISHESHVTLPLKATAYDDYMHISIFAGPGPLNTTTLLHFPSWADFQFCTDNRTVNVYHSENLFVINIPPGLPTWYLKLTRSTTTAVPRSKDYVIISSE